MYCAVLTIALLLLPPPSLGLVDCLVACARCRARGEEYPGVLEVYCAMCRECNDRRREQTLRRQEGDQVIHNVDDYPEECPTPPPCESDQEDAEVPPAHTLKWRLTTTTPTSTTTTSTTRRPCPVVTGCKKNPRPKPPRCYYPCVPACPCPYPYPLLQQAASDPPLRSQEASTTGKATGHLYVYVGVPKDIMQKMNH